ncbi:hypothetical protein H9P43_005243 [Blastocladiella emersonii ATCC 22665]|nr:hypothetical protein H9P43_005243 [Blastocladiella emersonii ATCC 22665]
MELAAIVRRPDLAPADEPALATAAGKVLAAGNLSGWTAEDTTRLLNAASLRHSWSTATRTALLTALKLAARETQLGAPLYASEGFHALAVLAGLSDDGADSPRPDAACANEALKINSNLLLLNRQAAMNVFAHEQCLPRLIEMSKSESASLETTFLVFRVMFLVTASPDHVETITKAGVDHYASTIDRILAAPDSPPPFTRAATVSEVLKTIFNLQSFTGADHDTPSPIFPAATMRAAARVLTAFPLATPNPLAPPHSHAVHVLMCGPAGWCTPALVRVLAKDILEVELALLFPLVRGNDSKVVRDDSVASPDERVPPLMHLLAQVYEREPAAGSDVRRAVVDALTPADLDRSKSAEQGRSVTHFLIRLLTNVEFPRIREATETLLFAVCDKDASKMVAYTGLGPAAGFLVNRGLLTPDVLKGHGRDPAVNPITGQTEREAMAEAWNQMTDEEKEAEAEKLFVTFERLNKLGVIKAVDPTTGKEFARPS